MVARTSHETPTKFAEQHEMAVGLETADQAYERGHLATDE